MKTIKVSAQIFDDDDNSIGSVSGEVQYDDDETYNVWKRTCCMSSSLGKDEQAKIQAKNAIKSMADEALTGITGQYTRYARYEKDERSITTRIRRGSMPDMIKDD